MKGQCNGSDKIMFTYLEMYSGNIIKGVNLIKNILETKYVDQRDFIAADAGDDVSGGGGDSKGQNFTLASINYNKEKTVVSDHQTIRTNSLFSIYLLFIVFCIEVETAAACCC